MTNPRSPGNVSTATVSSTTATNSAVSFAVSSNLKTIG
jgi:hypothetical protein